MSTLHDQLAQTEAELNDAQHRAADLQHELAVLRTNTGAGHSGSGLFGTLSHLDHSYGTGNKSRAGSVAGSVSSTGGGMLTRLAAPPGAVLSLGSGAKDGSGKSVASHGSLRSAARSGTPGGPSVLRQLLFADGASPTHSHVRTIKHRHGLAVVLVVGRMSAGLFVGCACASVGCCRGVLLTELL